jgi:hypothetical protein
VLHNQNFGRNLEQRVTVRDAVVCEPPCERARCERFADATDGSPADAVLLGRPVCSGPAFATIGGMVFSNLRAVCAWLENLLTVASAEI